MASGVPLAKINHASTLGNTFQALEKQITKQSVHDNVYPSTVCGLQDARNKGVIIRREYMRPWYSIFCLQKSFLLICGGSNKNLWASLSFGGLEN
jgi:hypothetical protein